MIHWSDFALRLERWFMVVVSSLLQIYVFAALVVESFVTRRIIFTDICVASSSARSIPPFGANIYCLMFLNKCIWKRCGCITIYVSSTVSGWCLSKLDANKYSWKINELHPIHRTNKLLQTILSPFLSLNSIWKSFTVATIIQLHYQSVSYTQMEYLPP